MRPYVRISEDGEKFLKKGQMWMYRNNVIELDESLENGCVVDILTTTDEYLGTGFLSKLSHITVRILSKNRNEELNRTFFKNRIQFAYDHRKTVEREIIALLTSKNGFSVVAPINIKVPSSTNGRR